MQSPAADANKMTALLQEYNSLKTEILARSNAQHTLLNLNVTILGTLIGLGIATNADPLILLVVPVVSASIGFLYLDHHTAIQRAGVYIDGAIRPAVQELSSSTNDLWTWETFFNESFWRRPVARSVFWFPLIVLFILAPTAASIYTAAIPKSPILWVTWTVGAITEVALLILGALMFSKSWVRGYRNGLASLSQD